MRDILRRLQRGEITLEEAESAIEDREVTPSRPPVGTQVRREAYGGVRGSRGVESGGATLARCRR